MKNRYLEEYNRRNLRVCQLKQLDILEEIDRLCRRHSISYWLDGGTLLGAVRHGGFIPWDDDIDIAMRREDMERFAAEAAGELPPDLFLQTRATDPEVELPIVKVRDMNSFYVEAGDNFAAGYQKGLYVDVFPFEDYPTVSRGFVKRITKGISKSNSILHKAHHYSVRAAAELFWFGGKYAAYSALWAAACALKPKGTYIGNIPTNNGYGIMHRKDSVFPLTEVEVAADGETTAWDVFAQALDAIMGDVDYLLGSGPDEFAYLGGGTWEENAAALARDGRTVIARDGARGSMALFDGKVVRADAYRVEVEDTVGAGDVYNAGFISGILAGRDISEALRLGNAVSGYTVARKGSRSTPTAQELEEFMSAHEG